MTRGTDQIQTDAHATNYDTQFSSHSLPDERYDLWTYDQNQMYTFITNDEKNNM